MLIVILSLGAYVEMIDLLVLLLLLVCWLVWLLMHTNENIESILTYPQISLTRSLLYFTLGLGAMQLGSYLIVNSAEALALQLGVSPYVVGLSIVAIGTSLPS